MTIDFSGLWKDVPGGTPDPARNQFADLWKAPDPVQGIGTDTAGPMDAGKPSDGFSFGNLGSMFSKLGTAVHDAPVPGIAGIGDYLGIGSNSSPNKGISYDDLRRSTEQGGFGGALAAFGGVAPVDNLGVESAIGAGKQILGLGRAAPAVEEAGSLGIRELTAPEGSLALPAPKPTLASGANADEPFLRGAIPMDGAIAEPSPRGSFWNAPDKSIPPIEGEFRELPSETAPITAADLAPKTTAPTDISTDAGFRQAIAEAQARTNPIATEDLANRLPVSRTDAGGGAFAQAADAAAPKPIALEDLVPGQLPGRSEIEGIKATEGAGAQADALNARLRAGVAERTPTVDAGAPDALSQQLADSLRAKGRPDLVVGDVPPERFTRPMSDYVATKPDLAARHVALDDAIHAIKTGDMNGAEAALTKLKTLGGDLNHAAGEMRDAGVPLGPVKRSGITLDDLKPISGGAGDLTRADLEIIRQARAAARAGKFAEPAPVAAREAYMTSVPGEAPVPRSAAPATPPSAPGKYVASGGERPAAARTPAGPPPRIAPGTPGTTVPGAAGRVDKLSLMENIATLPKTTTTLLSPEHAAGRHISSLALSHPNAYARGIGGGVSTAGQFLKSPAEARITMAKLNDSMRRELDARGLGVTEITSPHGGPRAGNDFMPSTLLNKMPGTNVPVWGGVARGWNATAGRVFEGTQAAFGQTQNIARFNAAKGEQSFLEWAKGRPLTQAEKDGAMERLNHFTGRGFRTQTPEAQSARASAAAGNPLDLPEKNAIASSNEKYKTAQMVGRIANIPMFSPQLRTSYARMVGDLATAVRHPTAPESLTTFRLAGGAVGAVGAYAAGAKAAGLNLDTDPNSSNFMKIDLGAKDQAKGVIALIASQLGAGTTSEDNGHVYLDATHGMAAYIKTIAQTVNDVRTGKKNFDGSPAMGNPTGNLLKGMLSPGLYDANELRLGNQVKPAGAVLPMTVSGPIEASGGKIGPTMQLAGGHLFKGEAPADIQIGPAPVKSAAPVKGASAPTTAPFYKTPLPIKTLKPATR